MSAPRTTGHTSSRSAPAATTAATSSRWAAPASVQLFDPAGAVAHDGQLADGHAQHEQKERGDDVFAVVDAQVVERLGVEVVEGQGGRDRREAAGEAAPEDGGADDDGGEDEGHVGRAQPVA